MELGGRGGKRRKKGVKVKGEKGKGVEEIKGKSKREGKGGTCLGSYFLVVSPLLLAKRADLFLVDTLPFLVSLPQQSELLLSKYMKSRQNVYL